VITAKTKHIQRAVLLFFIQLILNFAWSLLFFGLHNPQVALFEIALLWLTIIATAYEFCKHSRVAGWLLAPYAAWVAFALVLNAAIVSLN
jgi:translocator protein